MSRSDTIMHLGGRTASHGPISGAFVLPPSVHDKGLQQLSGVMHGLPGNKLRIKTIITGYAMGLHNLARHQARVRGLPKRSSGIMGDGASSSSLHATYIGKGD